MVPFLLGPIDNSSSFMLVSTINNAPAVLSAIISSDSTISYNLMTNLGQVLDPTVKNINLPIFSATGNLNSLTLTDKVNGGGIGIGSNNQMINVTDPIPLVFNQSSIANWNPPALFLSDIIYTVTTSDGTTVNPSQFYILSLSWYFRCPNNISACCIVDPQTLDAPGSLLNWFCVYDSTQTWCGNSYPATTKGWTSLSDCTIGNFYTYCPSSEYCGNNNCNGPCSNLNNNCNFVSDSYQCQVDLNKIASNSKWWESPIFIGSMIGLGIIIIFFIILVFIISREGSPVN